MNRIRQKRRELGLTMKELGAIVGVTEAAISHYETGRREPTPQMLCSLAHALRVSVDYLINDKDDQPATSTTTGEPEVRILARDMDQIPPEKRQKALDLLRMLMEEDEDTIDQATRVIKALKRND